MNKLGLEETKKLLTRKRDLLHRGQEGDRRSCAVCRRSTLELGDRCDSSKVSRALLSVLVLVLVLAHPLRKTRMLGILTLETVFGSRTRGDEQNEGGDDGNC